MRSSALPERTTLNDVIAMKTSLLTIALPLALFPLHALAGLISDSHLSLDSRTMYYNNDSRTPGTSQATSKQLGEGLILSGQSGFTPGELGIGVDAIGMLGTKIYGPMGNNTNTGLFPQHSDDSAPSAFGSARIAAKARMSHTLLRAGFQQPDLPVISTNKGRLFPALYRGYTLHSEDIRNLVLDAGFIDRVQGRNQTHYQLLKSTGKSTGSSSGFSYAGGRYQPMKSLAVSYYYAQLNDFYRQNYLGIRSEHNLGPGVITADTRYFLSRSEGNQYGGDADNNAVGGIVSYSLKGNRLGFGYQQLTGSGGFPYLDPGQSVDGISTDTSGGTTGLITDSPLSKFKTAHERAWVVRYNLNLARFGARDLSFNSSYVYGYHARVSQKTGFQNEWVRTFGLSYHLPESMVRDMTVSWKNVAYRTNISGTHSQDQNILLLTWHYSVL